MDFGSHKDKQQPVKQEEPQAVPEKENRSIPKPETFDEFFSGEPIDTVVNTPVIATQDHTPVSAPEDHTEPEPTDQSAFIVEPVIAEPIIDQPNQEDTPAPKDESEPSIQSPASLQLDYGKLPTESRVDEMLESASEAGQVTATGLARQTNFGSITDYLQGFGGDDWQPWVIYRRPGGGIGLKVVALGSVDDSALLKAKNVFKAATNEEIMSMEVVKIPAHEMAGIVRMNQSITPIIKKISNKSYTSLSEISSDLMNASCAEFLATKKQIKIRRNLKNGDTYNITTEIFDYLLNLDGQEHVTMIDNQSFLLAIESKPQEEIPLEYLLKKMDQQSADTIKKQARKGSGVIVIAGEKVDVNLEMAISIAGAGRDADGFAASIGFKVRSSKWVSLEPASAMVPFSVSTVALLIDTNNIPEFGRLAQTLASSGKLVVVCIKASSIPEAMEELLNNGMSVSFMINSVHLVALQANLPILCQDCARVDERESTAKHVNENTAWRRTLIDQAAKKLMRRGIGCPSCNFIGYSDTARIIEGIEISESDKDVKKSIQQRDFVDMMASINVQRRLWATSITYLVTGEIDSRDMEKNVQRTLFGK